MTKRWEDYHIDDFQSLPAVVLPKRLDADTVRRLHELGNAAAEREKQGLIRRHGTQHHWKHYLQAHGFIYDEDPQLVELLRGIMVDTDRQHWRFLPDEPTINVRLLEFHHYAVGGELTIGFDKHYDGGSVLTMVMMLSEPNVDFKGGQLRASALDWEDGKNETYVDVPLRNVGDCVVFPSHKYHQVSTVTEGLRNVAVMEIWTENFRGTEDDRAKIIIQIQPILEPNFDGY